MSRIVLLTAMGEEADALRRLGVQVQPTGVGKVAAAMHTQAAIDCYGARGLVFVGVAGSINPKLRPMDVLVARDSVQWDVDLSAFGTLRGELNDGRRFILTDETGSRLALEAAVRLGYPARLGRIATGDTFLADPIRARELHQTFQADAVEMEGAAAAQVADSRGVPLVLIRVISDAAGESAESSFAEFLTKASERAAAVVQAFLPEWETHLGA